jgi:hypothetical protein
MADAEKRDPRRERVRQVFAERRAARYQRAQRAATSGLGRGANGPRQSSSDKGRTRFIVPSSGALRRVGRFLRSFS